MGSPSRGPEGDGEVRDEGANGVGPVDVAGYELAADGSNPGVRKSLYVLEGDGRREPAFARDADLGLAGGTDDDLAQLAVAHQAGGANVADEAKIVIAAVAAIRTTAALFLIPPG